jgi:hypothetical protein
MFRTGGFKPPMRIVALPKRHSTNPATTAKAFYPRCRAGRKPNAIQAVCREEKRGGLRDKLPRVVKARRWCDSSAAAAKESEQTDTTEKRGGGLGDGAELRGEGKVAGGIATREAVSRGTGIDFIDAADHYAGIGICGNRTEQG